MRINPFRKHKKFGYTMLVLFVLGLSVQGYNKYYLLSWSDLAEYSRLEKGTEALNVSEWFGPGEPSYVFSGTPIPTKGQHIKVLKNGAYWVGYDTNKETPLWAAYRVFGVPKLDPVERPDKFIPDYRVWPPISPKQYTKTGYDRGHLVPNYVLSTRYPSVVESSFLTSNIMPQKPDLNRKVWKDLELLVSKKYAQKYGEVWVLVGPVFDANPKHIGPVPIPASCYMIAITVLQNKQLEMIAWNIPQDVSGKEDSSEFITSVHAIEELTGLNFNPTLPKHLEKIEWVKYPTNW